MKRRGIPSLTGIRGVAAVWVMLFHLQQSTSPYFGIDGLDGHPLIANGFRGVDLFFILSGFILMFAHERDFLEIGRENLVRFAKLRFLRVYPLNTVVLALLTVFIAFQQPFAAWFRSVHNPNDFRAIPYVKTLFLATHWYLPGKGDWNQPVWSLSLEILGYVAFPFLAYYAARVQRASTAVAVIAANYMLYVAALGAMHQIYLNAIAGMGIFRMFFAFNMGIAIYRLFILTESSMERWATWIGALALLVVLSVSVAPGVAVLMDLAFATLLYSLAFQRGWINAVVASGPVLFLGKISFPLYLVHAVPLEWVAFLALQHGERWSFSQKVLAIAGWVVGSILLATALHYWVERPVHELGRKWAKRSNAPAERVNAPVSS